MLDKSLFYDLGPVLTRNSTYNFVVGGRGIGKTYSAKKQVIRNYLRKGDQFIYLRRFRTDLASRMTFFDDIAHEFPEYGFRCHGLLAQVTRNPHDKKPTWETMGYFVALSNSGSKKSVAYPKVTIIIYDEFIIEKGHVQYLREECRVMLDFYSTVDRYQDRVRVLFLANSISIENPYFIEYEIEPKRNTEWITKRNGFITVHLPNDANFNAAVLETRFGKFIKDSEYAEYAVGNTFHDNNDSLIQGKPSHATYLLTLETSNSTFSVWRGNDIGQIIFYAQAKRPKDEIVFTMVADKMTDEKTMLHYSDKLAQTLRTAFKQGRVHFDSPRTRNAFIQVFKR